MGYFIVDYTQQTSHDFEFYLSLSVFSISKMVDRIECIGLIGYIFIVMKSHKIFEEDFRMLLSPCSIWLIGTSGVGLARGLFSVIPDSIFKTT